jgi:Rab3 GTPase-activating protein regulatory subunit C-terminus
VLHHIESYLKIVEAKKNVFEQNVVTDASETTHRYDDVFLSGNGRIAEIIASWIIDSGVAISSAEFDSFLTDCRFHFPLSCRDGIIAAHMSWQNFQTWSKNHSELKHLEMALECLTHLKCKGSHLQSKNMSQ